MAFAKTTRPSLANAVPRPAVWRALDKARRQPITWVSGPPGSGKTTIVSGYLANRRVRNIWYQMDAGDSDAATFFLYLAGAAPRRGAPLPQLTLEYRDAIPIFARRYFHALYARCGASFAIVFDNYQEVPAAAALHDILSVAAEELPRGGR